MMDPRIMEMLKRRPWLQGAGMSGQGAGVPWGPAAATGPVGTSNAWLQALASKMAYNAGREAYSRPKEEPYDEMDLVRKYEPYLPYDKMDLVRKYEPYLPKAYKALETVGQTVGPWRKQVQNGG